MEIKIKNGEQSAPCQAERIPQLIEAREKANSFFYRFGGLPNILLTRPNEIIAYRKLKPTAKLRPLFRGKSCVRFN